MNFQLTSHFTPSFEAEVHNSCSHNQVYVEIAEGAAKRLKSLCITAQARLSPGSTVNFMEVFHICIA